jgi:4-amino-4-deoxy-L-arabinose transferase-like glycosyltransferase
MTVARPTAAWGERGLLACVLLLALALRVWGLGRSGWGAEYYTAAVRSMALNWHNFFYAAFDPLGFISVDKPPLALWLQVLSVKLAGFNPGAVLAPQVAEGVASVWLLHHLVRRRSSAAAALLAAFFFASSPVWVAVNRTNNMDSCLVLVLLLAAWALIKAAETGSRRFLLVAAAVVGVAFNVKMLAACIVLPCFALVYLRGAPLRWTRRMLDLGLAAIVLLAVSLPWVTAVQVTPADRRPYVGSTRGNSMLELVVGHNAIGRFVKVGPRRPQLPVPAEEPGLDPRATARHLELRLFPRSPVGPLRLFKGQFAAQAGWLLPLALAGLLLGLARKAGGKTGPEELGLWLWLSWTGIFWIVYSCLGGIVHFYYLATLAPALAALAGIGVVSLWERHLDGRSHSAVLPGALALTLVWQFHVEGSALDGNWPELGNLHHAVIAGVLLAAGGLGWAAWRRPRPRWLERGSLALGLAALSVLPSAWALSSVLAPGQGTVPSADLQRLLVARRDPEAIRRVRFGLTADTSGLVQFLRAHRRGEAFLLATSTTQLAAPIIIETGEPVMARGGFHGLDRAVDPARLALLVQTGQVRFAMLGDVATVSRRMGADAAGMPVAAWIREHGALVDPALWGGSGPGGRWRLYDLRPEGWP